MQRAWVGNVRHLSPPLEPAIEKSVNSQTPAHCDRSTAIALFGHNLPQGKEELDMPFGRSRLYEHGEVAEQGDVAAAPVSVRSDSPSSTAREARREIDTLRSINAHLIRQIAVLKQREAQAQHLAD